MENVAVSLISSGEFRNVVMPTDFVNDLVVTLRKKGTCEVYLSKGETIQCEGLAVFAKGSKNQLMVFNCKE